jgi:ribosome-binding factor A
MSLSRRPDRVAEAVREEIATVLAEGIKGQEVSGLVTVTGVEMTRDLGRATVFVSVYGDDKARAHTLEQLQRLAPGLRSRVGRALHLRLAPEIGFRLDDSIARAARIESLLNSLKTPDRDEPPAAPRESDHARD